MTKKKQSSQESDIILRTGIGEYWYCCGIYSDGAGHGYITGANVWCPVAAWGPTDNLRIQKKINSTRRRRHFSVEAGA